jgi:hypothetical protein
MKQFIATQNQLMQAVHQKLNQLQATELPSTALELLDAEATCSKAPAPTLQPHRMHQLKEAIMMELVSSVV